MPTLLAQVLSDGLGLHNPLLVERLYRMFDINGDGNLGASEIASGLLLVAYGGAEERLNLVFELFDGLGGTFTRTVRLYGG